VKKMLTRLAPGALALALLTGCTISHVSIGSPIDEASMQDISPGESDEADVLRVFGAPNRIVRHAEGDMFIYEFVKRVTRTIHIEEPVITGFELFSYSSSDEREDRLIVLFTEEGLVESFGYTDGIPEREDEDEPDAR
jgi:hypothetical protein